jgi:hypothetical protein
MEGERPQQEAEGIAVRPVAWTTGVVVIVALLAILVAGVQTVRLTAARVGRDAARRSSAGGGALLETPIASRRARPVDARAALERFAWLDAQHGELQIPIDEAIELYLTRAGQ